jgi:hypothetical protein
MSSLADSVMSHLTENFLWMRTLTTTPQLEREVSTPASQPPTYLLTHRPAPRRSIRPLSISRERSRL